MTNPADMLKRLTSLQDKYRDSIHSATADLEAEPEKKEKKPDTGKVSPLEKYKGNGAHPSHVRAMSEADSKLRHNQSVCHSIARTGEHLMASWRSMGYGSYNEASQDFHTALMEMAPHMNHKDTLVQHFGEKAAGIKVGDTGPSKVDAISHMLINHYSMHTASGQYQPFQPAQAPGQKAPEEKKEEPKKKKTTPRQQD